MYLAARARAGADEHPLRRGHAGPRLERGAEVRRDVLPRPDDVGGDGDAVEARPRQALAVVVVVERMLVAQDRVLVPQEPREVGAAPICRSPKTR